MSAKRPRIAYVSASDPTSRRSWSGTHHAMSEALQHHCGDVSHIGPLVSEVTRWLHRIDRVCRGLTGRRYNAVHSLLLSMSFSRTIERRLRDRPHDLIFAPVGSTEIAALRTALPIIYASDGTFALLHEYYPAFMNLSRVSVWEGHQVERRAIAKAKRLVYSTEWAARSAIQHYGATPAKIHVIPYGANLSAIPEPAIATARARGGVVRLLFLGSDWERKGGAIALDSLRELNKAGVPARLTICGCTPPDGTTADDVRVVPFLDKNDSVHRTQLADLLLGSDLLLVPTRADCSPIVFSEANAFGLPVVTTDTGGVSGVIRPGENGLLRPWNADGAEYARRIRELMAAHGCYEELVRSSRHAFDTRLNWDAWGVGMSTVVAELC